MNYRNKDKFMTSLMKHARVLLALTTLWLLTYWLWPEGVSAAERYLVGIPGIDDPEADFSTYVNALYALSISVAAMLAVIKIIVAGVKYMLSDVVTSKEEAKKDIQGSLIGLLIVVSAVLILTTINPQLTDTQVFLQEYDSPANPVQNIVTQGTCGPNEEFSSCAGGPDQAGCTPSGDGRRLCSVNENQVPDSVNERLYINCANASCEGAIDVCENSGGRVGRTTLSQTVLCVPTDYVEPATPPTGGAGVGSGTDVDSNTPVAGGATTPAVPNNPVGAPVGVVDDVNFSGTVPGDGSGIGGTNNSNSTGDSVNNNTSPTQNPSEPNPPSGSTNNNMNNFQDDLNSGTGQNTGVIGGNTTSGGATDNNTQTTDDSGGGITGAISGAADAVANAAGNLWNFITGGGSDDSSDSDTTPSTPTNPTNQPGSIGGDDFNAPPPPGAVPTP